MTDLISRAEAILEIEEYSQGLDSCISEPDLKLDGYRNGLQVAIQELQELPAVDAVPVEWLKYKQQESLNENDRDMVGAIEAIFIEWHIYVNQLREKNREAR